MVALDLPIGLRVAWRGKDVSDSHKTQVVTEGSGDVARTIVGEQQFGRLTRALVRSSRGTSVMPVRSTASWITSINEVDVMSI